MDTTSTPKDLIPPATARALWAELRPDPPESDAALLRRTERGTGPRAHLVDGPGQGRRMYGAAEVEHWLLGPRALAAVEMAQLVARAGALGYALLLDGREDDPPAVDILGPDEEVVYSGDLAGARRWLAEEEGERIGGTGP